MAAASDLTWQDGGRRGAARPLLVAAAVVALVAGALAGAGRLHRQELTPGAVAADSWRMPGYGPTGSRWNPAETRVTLTTLSSLAQRWSYAAPLVRPIGGGEPCRVNGDRDDLRATVRPVVAEGRLYTLQWGGAAALALTDGHPLWSVRDPLEDAHPFGLVADAGMVAVNYAMCAPPTPSSAVRGFWVRIYDGATGAVRNTVITGRAVATAGGRLLMHLDDGDSGGNLDLTQLRSLDGTTTVWSTQGYIPKVISGSVVVTEAGSNYSEPPTPPGVYGLDQATGALRWSRTDLRRVLGGNRAGTQIYALTASGTLRAVNSATGSTAWSSPVRPTGAPVAADAARVYVPCSAGLCAVSQARGGSVWTYAGTGAAPAVVAVSVAGAVVYTAEKGSSSVCVGDDLCPYSQVQSLAAATGVAGPAVLAEPDPVDAPVVTGGRVISWSREVIRVTAVARVRA